MFPRKRCAGFTLIELIIVLVLVSIVAAIALPSFSQLIESNRQTAVTNSFLGMVNYARAEAVRRGESVEVTPQGASFVASAFPGGARTTIREIEALPGNASIVRTDGGADLTFLATGRSNATAAPATYRICGASGADGAVIRVNRGGQVNRDPAPEACP